MASEPLESSIPPSSTWKVASDEPRAPPNQCPNLGGQPTHTNAPKTVEAGSCNHPHQRISWYTSTSAAANAEHSSQLSQGSSLYTSVPTAVVARFCSQKGHWPALDSSMPIKLRHNHSRGCMQPTWDTPGAPGSGYQEQFCHWAPQDIFYIRALSAQQDLADLPNI